MRPKGVLKRLLGEMPYVAEFYWWFVQGGRPITKGFTMGRLEKHLPRWRALVSQAAQRSPVPIEERRRIVVFAMLRHWIEHAAVLSLALAGFGHSVTLTFLPYPSFLRSMPRFDVRRQNAYARHLLSQAQPTIQVLSLLDVGLATRKVLSAPLIEAIRQVSLRDTQYSLQIESFEAEREDNPAGRLYRLRLERNLYAAAAFVSLVEGWEASRRPQVVLVPNGSILEMGAIYQAARHLGIPAVTYEFGEQRERIWFARNDEVMSQNTDDLWQAFQDHALQPTQWERLEALYKARKNAQLWENFSRLWQGLPMEGGEQARHRLSLDERPIALLAANVIGDSLTLGRQIFSRNMSEWLSQTVRYFAERPNWQLVVRIHPGERYLKGPSVAQVVEEALGGKIPSHLRLVQASDPINTYDLVQIADLGLAYTTTVGLEMAMNGLPVIVGGRTHYRGRGFTLDPQSWEEYFAWIERVLSDPKRYRLERLQVERAWKYAYHFFFDYPAEFPWHMRYLWEDLEAWPLERVLSSEGWERFGETFRGLAGEPRRWFPQEVVKDASMKVG